VQPEGAVALLELAGGPKDALHAPRIEARVELVHRGNRRLRHALRIRLRDRAARVGRPLDGLDGLRLELHVERLLGRTCRLRSRRRGRSREQNKTGEQDERSSSASEHKGFGPGRDSCGDS
jgi:hypothetical protein